VGDKSKNTKLDHFSIFFLRTTFVFINSRKWREKFEKKMEIIFQNYAKSPSPVTALLTAESPVATPQVLPPVATGIARV